MIKQAYQNNQHQLITGSSGSSAGIYRLAMLALSLLYGFVLSQLPDIQFKDFSNYLVYGDSSWLIASRYAEGGLLHLLSNEPVWLLMNAGLELFLEPETVVRTIIFLGGSSIAWLIFTHYPQHFIWLILFLLLPQVVKNYLIHLRQGAAIAIFLWGWFAPQRIARLVLLILTPFIHASFFFIIVLLSLTWFLRKIRFAADLRTIAYIAIAISVGLSLGFLAQLFEARQSATYAFVRTDVSGLGFALWLMVCLTMLSAGNRWLREHSFETSIVIFYLATYWLIEVTARIFEGGLMLVLLAGLALPGWRRQLFLGLVIGAGIFSWSLRIGTPGLGFVAG